MKGKEGEGVQRSSEEVNGRRSEGQELKEGRREEFKEAEKTPWHRDRKINRIPTPAHRDLSASTS